MIKINASDCWTGRSPEQRALDCPLLSLRAVFVAVVSIRLAGAAFLNDFAFSEPHSVMLTGS